MMKNRIRLYRKEKGLTQAVFAKILQVTQYKFRSLENGKVLPSQDLAIKIAQILEVSIDEAFFIEENRC
ncbi:helix-turn-helix transcriptional regulator [Pedobacter sp. FW305-3-2-15-E-R2A2]|uniref:helix-turn-helix transcriptional regulator n=1 Tax=Pedobacter sp. FW305-3-2-15-E-R2A2 TaxID=3140251 RepID=UPI003140A95A